MMMRLQHKRPDGEMDTYHLKPGRRYHLGRGSSCEIRILDLKLSRKHCVIEYSDGAWHIEDLCSTNGCLVNGQQIVGNAPLLTGTRIEAGTTALAVSALVAPGEDSSAAPVSEYEIEPAAMPAQTEVEPAAVHAKPVVRDARRETPAIQQESMPDKGTDELPAPAHNDWEPEPASASLEGTGALQPIARGKPRAAPAPRVADANPEISTIISPDTLIQPGPALTPRHAAPAAPARSAAPHGLPTAETRPAPRIKPVTIRVGRIEGAEEHSPMAEPVPAATVPTPVAAVPVPAPAPVPVRVEPFVSATEPFTAAPAAPVAGEERTFFITVLGRRVGPLTRSAARELKARELKGTLSQSEIETYPPA